MDRLLEQKLVELIDGFQSAAAAGGKAVAQALPQITEYAIRLKYWECLGQVLLGVCLVLIAFVVYFAVTRPSWGKSSKFEAYNWTAADICAFVSGVVALVLLLVGGFLCLNPWNWTGIVEPKVALAHDIYVAVMQKLGK